MDETNKDILRLLRDNGRMSFTDIGKELGISRVAVMKRVKKLEEERCDEYLFLGDFVSDTPYTRELFEEYVIPFSNDINTVADFDIALEKVNAGKRPHENDVAHFFLHCIQSAFPTIPNIKAGVKTYIFLKMSPEIIEANMDIFDKLAEKRGKYVSKDNLYQYLKILTVLDDGKAFCEEVNRFADMNADDPKCGLHHITEEDYDSFFE